MLKTSKEKNTINNNNNNNNNNTNKSILTKIIQLSPLKNNNKDKIEEINEAIASNDLNHLTNLLDSENNHNIYNHVCHTPLFLCIDLDNFEALNILLKHGANCNIKNNEGNTPLHIAIIQIKENIINILLENGANPNIPNNIKNQTPFHLAIINKVDKRLLQKFKEKNADWNIKDIYDKTPFDYALELKDNNYLLLLDDIFGKKEKGENIDVLKKKIIDVNPNNFKSLPKYNKSNLLKDKMKNIDENKENINFYNIKGDTKANTISDVYSPRENHSKKQLISVKNENIIEENININDLKDFSLSESSYKILHKDYLINEKENDSKKYEKRKYQSLADKESNDLMKKIIMDTVKKINNCQVNKSLDKKNLSFENNSKNYRNSQSSLNELNPSDTNHYVSGISTIFDETINSNTINLHNKNNSTFIKTELEDNNQIINKENKNENKDGDLIIIKDLINNSSNNEIINNSSTKDSINLKINPHNIYNLKNINNNNKDMKYMIMQQIKEKNKKTEFGSPSRVPNEILTKLRYWLISCDLLNYYNIFIEKHIYSIDEIIYDIKNKKINVDYKFVENLGIKKPGHIFRFLLKLQIDADILDKQICYAIFEKYSNNNSSTILLNSSLNDIKCCGIPCFSHSPCSSDVNESINGINNNDIFSFLRSKDLFEYRENFIHNGFDQVDYIIIQLFSNFKFDKNMMVEYLHIYLEDAQQKIIKKLYEEKEKLSKELGIPFDENEINEILSSYKDDLSEEGNKENCFIF